MSWFVSWKACSRFKKCALTPIFLKTGGAGRTIKWLKKLLWHFLEGSTSKDPNGKSFCGIPPSPIKEMKWYVVSVPLGDWKLWSRLHKALHLGVLFKISRDLISQKSGGLTPPPPAPPPAWSLKKGAGVTENLEKASLQKISDCFAKVFKIRGGLRMKIETTDKTKQSVNHKPLTTRTANTCTFSGASANAGPHYQK